MSRPKRRSERRPIPTLAEREARAREATTDRHRREATERTRALAERARILLADVHAHRLERAAARVRADREREARHAALQPVHERLVALARADLVAAIHETSDTFEWSPA